MQREAHGTDPLMIANNSIPDPLMAPGGGSEVLIPAEESVNHHDNREIPSSFLAQYEIEGSP